jgi:hypothetical protein
MKYLVETMITPEREHDDPREPLRKRHKMSQKAVAEAPLSLDTLILAGRILSSAHFASQKSQHKRISRSDSLEISTEVLNKTLENLEAPKLIRSNEVILKRKIPQSKRVYGWMTNFKPLAPPPRLPNLPAGSKVSKMT